MVRRRGWDAGIAAAVVVGTWLIGWFRLAPIARHTIWAEDGRNFLGDRLGDGILPPLFRSYAGYVHLVPRLVADLTVALTTIPHYATTLTALSLLVTALVAAAVYVCSAEVVSWRPARIGLAAVTVILAAAPVEVLGNAANLHSSFLWLAPWLLLAGPMGPWATAALAALGFAGGATEIQMAVFLPLAVMYRWKEPRRWWIRGAVVAGLVCQGVITLLHPRHQHGALPRPGSIIDGYLANVVGGAYTGSERLVAHVASHQGIAWFAIGLLPVVAAVAYVAWRGVAVERLAAGALVVASIMLWVAAVLVNHASNVITYAGWTDRQWKGFLWVRYGVVPAMLLLATLPLAAGVAARLGRRVLPWFVVALVAVPTTLSFHVKDTTRSGGPDWTAQVAKARRECAQESPQGTVDVRLAPDGWWLTLTCQHLARL